MPDVPGVLQDGHLVFVNDDKNGRPEQVFIGRRNGQSFNDYRWHRLKIRRNGRRVSYLYTHNFLLPSGDSFLMMKSVLWLTHMCFPSFIE